MKKMIFAVCFVSALLSMAGSTAYAQLHELDIVGFQAGGRALSVEAGSGSDYVNGYYQVGAFNFRLDGGPLVDNAPLYCLDLFHSFNFQQDPWMVNLIPVPPDPNPGGAPINTAHAAWIYQNYGSNSELADVYATYGAAMMNARAQAVQIALWEVSHETDWLASWPSANWWVDGDFKVNTFDTFYYMYDTTWSMANDILGTLYSTIGAGGDLGDARATWYQPLGWPDQCAGQGQIGDYTPPEVPEPGTLLLLGTGLLAIAGGAWRRRQK